ncbi:DNA-binding transcriptional regulator YiaG [Phyllobacterium ifriqiyense]|uniref:DNA-binding transcriptional regulator YiaG n=1 Tax=Phyllobacterium ifriqiyense TaxID=314238 RepID=A0ABU0SFF9_9HYPH|nr:DNA-binding transcriptional regulator YiaG [Phyllobacterium ifriqiyense]
MISSSRSDFIAGIFYVFEVASYLNTSESTIQKWESGAKRPSGMALKLLAVVQKHGLQVLS